MAQGASLSPKPDDEFRHKAVSAIALHQSTKAQRFSVQESFRDFEQKRQEALELRQADEARRKKEAAEKQVEEAKKAGSAVDPGCSEAVKQTRVTAGRPPKEKGTTEYERRQQARKDTGQKNRGSNDRLAGAPILRRDPCAWDKVHIAMHLEKKARKAEVKPEDISNASRKFFEDRV